MSAAATPTAGEIVQHVALLEAEIASLRAVLKRLKGERAEGRDEAAA